LKPFAPDEAVKRGASRPARGARIETRAAGSRRRPPAVAPRAGRAD